MSISDINYASKHIQNQTDIIKEHANKLSYYDWEEILQALPEKDRESLINEISTAISGIEIAVERIVNI